MNNQQVARTSQGSGGALQTNAARRSVQPSGGGGMAVMATIFNSGVSLFRGSGGNNSSSSGGVIGARGAEQAIAAASPVLPAHQHGMAVGYSGSHGGAFSNSSPTSIGSSGTTTPSPYQGTWGQGYQGAVAGYLQPLVKKNEAWDYVVPVDDRLTGEWPTSIAGADNTNVAIMQQGQHARLMGVSSAHVTLTALQAGNILVIQKVNMLQKAKEKNKMIDLSTKLQLKCGQSLRASGLLSHFWRSTPPVDEERPRWTINVCPMHNRIGSQAGRHPAATVLLQVELGSLDEDTRRAIETGKSAIMYHDHTDQAAAVGSHIKELALKLPVVKAVGRLYNNNDAERGIADVIRTEWDGKLCMVVMSS